MGRGDMPCSITDDPYSDASDFYEKEGVYKIHPDDVIEFDEEDEDEPT